ncbi:MAG: hypothetical protein IMY82_01875, partial [Chloroflexi bacterium]|nr:hypothetical protein [Chloroflexota bacterium]
DNEIRRIVYENYEIARKELESHQQQLIDLSEVLLEKETLDGAEICSIVFPDGEPDYLKPKAEEEPFKFEAAEEAEDEVPQEAALAVAGGPEEKPEA